MESMKSLTIGFEGRNAVTNLTGLGNYSRRVADVLSNMHPDWRFRLYAPETVENPRLTPILERDNVALCTPVGRYGVSSTGCGVLAPGSHPC